MPPITTIKSFQNDPYEQYTRKVASAESGGQPNARNPFGAAGLYQFVPSTWRNLTQKYNLNYSQDDRLDPDKSKKVMKLFTEENKKQLSKRLGRQPDDYELYLAHGFGAAGAGRLIEGINKNPNIRTDQFFSPIILKQNRSLLFNKDGSAKTLGEISNHFKAKMSVPASKYTNSEKQITPQETVENLQEVNNRLTDLVFTKELPNFEGVSYVPDQDENVKKLEEKQTEREVIREREVVQQEPQEQAQVLEEDTTEYYVDPNQTYAEIDSFLQMQKGGTTYVNSIDDPRYQAYQDSLYLYEENRQLKKQIQQNPMLYMASLRNVDNSNNGKTFDSSITFDENEREIIGISPVSRTNFRNVTKNPVKGRPDIITNISIGNYKKPEQEVIVKNKAGYQPKADLYKQQREVQSIISKVEEQGVAQVYDNIMPESNLNLLSNAQMPSSFTVSEYNQRMDGTQGYGSERYDSNADADKVLRAMNYQDAYNQDIERRYNNPEAQNNLKAQERYNTLRNYLNVSPNYQIGGEIPTSPLGMWQYPNQTVRVPSGNITMNFMKHPIEAISEQTGERVILKPNENYTFKNTTSVIEKPIRL